MGAQTVVRDFKNKYFVIDKDGRVVCGPYRYAGDPNSSGNRVVWDFDAHCSIVNNDGSSWFKTLEAIAVAKTLWVEAKVPHKGIAAVKDAKGWYYVDDRGQQVGKGRFEEVEPHYNGQARVKLFNGEWAVVDELGDVSVSLGLSQTAGALELEALSKQWWQALALKKILATNVLHGDDRDTLRGDPRLRSVLLDAATELGLLSRTDGKSGSVGNCGFSLLTKGALLAEENTTSDRCRYWLQDRYLRAWLQHGNRGDVGDTGGNSFGSPPSRFLQPGNGSALQHILTNARCSTHSNIAYLHHHPPNIAYLHHHLLTSPYNTTNCNTTLLLLYPKITTSHESDVFLDLARDPQALALRYTIRYEPMLLTHPSIQKIHLLSLTLHRCRFLTHPVAL